MSTKSATPREEVREGDAPADARRRLQVDVGARVRAVRTRLGVGQAECARAAGVDTSSLFRLEKGDQNVTIDMIGRLAVALGVEMDELLVGVRPDPAIVAQRPRA
ncbi:helix-turn-helix domain-containing protein [Sphingomonas sp. TX0522]|uniref:helix-turn-helix domain-containing protein n=1 Tax=Sphingomonas sp. TX0522 TaxID=2479205 RepID=UPI0018DF3993|nr:XRE family transcriptional regulator [Sphingomonas sp. TX0522]